MIAGVPPRHTCRWTNRVSQATRCVNLQCQSVCRPNTYMALDPGGLRCVLSRSAACFQNLTPRGERSRALSGNTLREDAILIVQKKGQRLFRKTRTSILKN